MRAAERDLEVRTVSYAPIHQRYGLLFGLLAGLSYALAAWGVDGLSLALANGIHPWAKLAVGAMYSLVLGGLIGWFSARVDKGIVNLVLWGLLGVVFGWLAAYVPSAGVSNFIARTDPEVARRINYSLAEAIEGRLAITYLVTAGISVLAGAVMNLLVEMSSRPNYPFARLVPVVVWVALFVVAGSTVDSLFNRQLREPLVTLDEMIEFAADHQGEELDSQTARAMHLSALAEVQDLVTRPRGLIVGRFDATLYMVDVMVDFDGVWAACSLVNSNPGFCRLLE